MPRQDEVAQLEEERARLQSMIAYHNRPVSVPARSLMLGLAFGIVILMLIGLFSGEIAISTLAFSVVIFGLAAYILTRKVTLFGAPYPLFEIVFMPLGWVPSPLGPDAGETEARQRIADCEARIKKLKEAP